MNAKKSDTQLEVNNIEVVYNDIVQVLRGVSLKVPEGSIVALLGTNGAGKTTTLRAISGLLKPENGFIREGYVKFRENDITNMLGTHVVKLGAVMVPEGRRVFKHLSVDENIRVGSITRKDGALKIRADHELMYRHFPRLSNITHRMAGYCSGGEQQMIAIARALMAAPKMLMLDEPSLGLAPLLVKEIFENIQLINKEMNTTILVVEQNAKIALGISDYAYIMESGKIVLEGPSKELQENPDVKEFYMGITQGGGENLSRRSNPTSGVNGGYDVWENPGNEEGMMKFLVGYNGSDVAKAALSLARTNAENFGAMVFVVTSMGGGRTEKPEEIAKVAKELEHAEKFLKEKGVACETHQLARGLTPGEDLLRFAEENEVDQMYLGVEKKSRTQKIIVGSTAQFLILKAPCPVVSVNRWAK